MSDDATSVESTFRPFSKAEKHISIFLVFEFMDCFVDILQTSNSVPDIIIIANAPNTVLKIKQISMKISYKITNSIKIYYNTEMVGPSNEGVVESTFFLVKQ